VKIFEILIAIAFGLVGLAMSTCGLVFSLTGLGNAYGVLVLSIPAFLIGCGLLWLAKVMWKSAHAPKAAPAQPPGDKPAGPA
jgi:hypothetical protein